MLHDRRKLGTGLPAHGESTQAARDHRRARSICHVVTGRQRAESGRNPAFTDARNRLCGGDSRARTRSFVRIRTNSVAGAWVADGRASGRGRVHAAPRPSGDRLPQPSDSVTRRPRTSRRCRAARSRACRPDSGGAWLQVLTDVCGGARPGCAASARCLPRCDVPDDLRGLLPLRPGFLAGRCRARLRASRSSGRSGWASPIAVRRGTVTVITVAERPRADVVAAVDPDLLPDRPWGTARLLRDRSTRYATRRSRSSQFSAGLSIRKVYPIASMAVGYYLIAVHYLALAADGAARLVAGGGRRLGLGRRQALVGRGDRGGRAVGTSAGCSCGGGGKPLVVLGVVFVS